MVRFIVALTALGIPAVACAIAVVALPGASSDRGPLLVRTEVVDRNGIVLAATASAPSLFANPRHIGNARSVAARLAQLIPGSNEAGLRARLGSNAQFVWIARWVPDAVAKSVANAHLSGVGIRRELVRQYPLGRVTAHVVGYTELDSGLGSSGIESFLDQAPMSEQGPLRLTIDSRVQRAVWEELQAAVRVHHALGAVGLVLDARSAEVLASVSLPDFDPNDHSTIVSVGIRNKVSSSVYEMGGVFGMFVTALALEDHRITTQSLIDVTHPLRLAGETTLQGEEPSGHPLSVADVFAQSSVIGAARIAQLSEPAEMRAFLKKLGLMDTVSIETGDAVPHPLYTSQAWEDLWRTTVGYGYGIAVTPLQAAAAASSLVNGGTLMAPTLVLRDPEQTRTGYRVVSARTSADLRKLLRNTVLHGTGAQADVPGYSVGGKTGTSAQFVSGHYTNDLWFSWFVCAFPLERATPRYTLLVMLELTRAGEGAGLTGRPATRWTAAPVAGQIIRKIGPLLEGARESGS